MLAAMLARATTARAPYPGLRLRQEIVISRAVNVESPRPHCVDGWLRGFVKGFLFDSARVLRYHWPAIKGVQLCPPGSCSYSDHSASNVMVCPWSLTSVSRGRLAKDDGSGIRPGASSDDLAARR